MRKWTPVEVIWRDAHGGDPGWIELTPDYHSPMTIVSVGMVANDCKKGVTLALSRTDGDPRIAAFIFIPRSNIVKVRKLVPK